MKKILVVLAVVSFFVVVGYAVKAYAGCHTYCSGGVCVTCCTTGNITTCN